MVDKADSRCHITEAPQKHGGAGGRDSDSFVVPSEPTERMLRAGIVASLGVNECLDGELYLIRQIWDAMLRSAPEVPRRSGKR